MQQNAKSQDCQEYINEYYELKLIKGNYNINDNDDFEDVINNGFKLIEKICDKTQCGSLLLADSELGNFYNSSEYNSLDNDNMLLIKETYIELFKRQLGLLINELCGQCVKPDNVQLTKHNCERYIREYNSLRFINNIDEYDFNNKQQFILDMKITINVIKNIQSENNNIDFSKLIDIDENILKYFDKEQFVNDIDRKIAANLLTDQLYVMIKIICNICKLKEIIDYDFDLDDEIRQPHDVKLAHDCTQTMKSQLNVQACNIVEKIKQKKQLDSNDKKLFKCVLLGKIRDTFYQKCSLERIYVDWIIDRIISGKNISGKNLVNIILAQNDSIKILYNDKSFEKFLDLNPILKSANITKWEFLNLYDLERYYNIFYRNQGIINPLVDTLIQYNLKKQQHGGTFNLVIYLHKLFYKLSKNIYLINNKYDFINKIINKNYI
jgi:hypothetical protein